MDAHLVDRRVPEPTFSSRCAYLTDATYSPEASSRSSSVRTRDDGGVTTSRHHRHDTAKVSRANAKASREAARLSALVNGKLDEREAAVLLRKFERMDGEDFDEVRPETR
jgi:hypothetical protein